MQLQIAADAVKAIMSGGVPTKIVAMGIGSGANLLQLQGMASPPVNETVIQVEFDNLASVQQQVQNLACAGKHDVSFAIMIHNHRLLISAHLHPHHFHTFSFSFLAFSLSEIFSP